MGKALKAAFSVAVGTAACLGLMYGYQNGLESSVYDLTSNWKGGYAAMFHALVELGPFSIGGGTLTGIAAYKLSNKIEGLNPA